LILVDWLSMDPFKASWEAASTFRLSPPRSRGRQSRRKVGVGYQVAWTSLVCLSQVPEEIEEWDLIPLTNRITKDQTPGPSLFFIVSRSQPLLCCRWEMLMFAKMRDHASFAELLFCFRSLLPSDTKMDGRVIFCGRFTAIRCWKRFFIGLFVEIFRFWGNYLLLVVSCRLSGFPALLC
jgi:hypothetical protein